MEMQGKANYTPLIIDRKQNQDQEIATLLNTHVFGSQLYIDTIS